MKKILLIIILSLFLSGCGIYNLGNFTVPDDIQFLECVAELDTPEEISNYMIDNFSYEKHLYKTVNPYELWQTGLGDCNDFACFGTFVAGYNGYETWQIMIYYETTTSTHYLGVYNEGVYSFTDNMKYYYGFDSFREVVNESGKHTGQDWKSYKVYDYEMNIIEIGEQKQ